MDDFGDDVDDESFSDDRNKSSRMRNECFFDCQINFDDYFANNEFFFNTNLVVVFVDVHESFHEIVV